MKLRHFFVLTVLAAFIIGCSQGIKEKTNLKDSKEKASYAMGFNIGSNMKGQLMEPDLEAMYAGLKDALVDGDTLITMEEMAKVMREFQAESMKKFEEKKKIESEENKKKGKAFLDENAKKDGITVLDNGIQYRVMESGNGKKPKATDKVKVHYTGRLIGGKVFDTSVGKDPAVFPLNGVIKGWTEILQLMKEGDKWEVFIPSELAYGDRGTPGGPIPPGSTLIFEISFISIEKEK